MKKGPVSDEAEPWGLVGYGIFTMADLEACEIGRVASELAF